ncbi:MAG TPA: PEP-CTERM sorting domain-containing protein [Verrucomicrobiae bacterium]|jgi:hypothetical protein
MLRIHLSSLALASGVLVATIHAAPFADAVVSYTPGAGFAPGYTDPSAALGEPSRVTPGMFGGPVDPFDPPFLATQIVSLGAGGSLTVQFITPIFNSPGHLYGLDFLIFGNAGFDTGPDFNGIANGSLFGQNTGATRVSVSADNVTYFELNPAFAPVVDTLFPTDGAGDFHTPVNPLIGAAAFAGQDLAGVRNLYAGSGGGAGFDLAWARDGGGQSVSLPSVNYIRVEVLSGKSEIDGFATVVPEPATWTLLGLGAVLGWAARRGASGHWLRRSARRPGSQQPQGSIHSSDLPALPHFPAAADGDRPRSGAVLGCAPRTAG